MTTLTRWLMDRQAETLGTDARFARHLGISPSLWCRLRAGKMEPGLSVLRAALRTYPDRRDEIVRCAFEFPQGTENVQQVEVMAS